MLGLHSVFDPWVLADAVHVYTNAVNLKNVVHSLKEIAPQDPEFLFSLLTYFS